MRYVVLSEMHPPSSTDHSIDRFPSPTFKRAFYLHPARDSINSPMGVCCVCSAGESMYSLEAAKELKFKVLKLQEQIDYVRSHFLSKFTHFI